MLLKTNLFIASIIMLAGCAKCQNLGVLGVVNSSVPKDIIEIEGQSNAGGAAFLTTLQSDLRSGVPGAYVYNYQASAWQGLDTTNNGCYAIDGVYTRQFGTELRLMKLLQAHYSRNMYLVKYTQYNTDLYGNTSPTWSNFVSGSLFAGSNTNYSNAMAALTSFAPAVTQRLKAIVWIQGVNDANATTASTYQAALTSFIAAKRAAYGYSVPFVIVRMSNAQTAYGSYTAVIQAAQDAVVANVANCYIVNTDGLSTQSDGVHYNAAGYDALASRIYNVVITIP
jgi:hypothetical protein